ncbi:MAG: choice-of-anchor D domain-containing protein, partial [Solirubrobacterales bacterium]|nr:choice-of-anchor D domain-containing protein [Solirubrobacterales bacterium]
AGGNTGTVSVQTSGGAAGVNNGSVTLALTSDGQGTSGLGTTALASQTANVSATGYRYAKASVSPSSQNLGNFHVADAGQGLAGSTAGGTVTVTNTQIGDGYSEGLDVGVNATSGNFSATSNVTSPIAAGGNTGTVSVQTSGGAAGVNNGSVTLALTSDGQGTSGLGTTALASQTADVSATGYAYAAATTSTGSLDLGAFHVGTDPAGKSFTVTNSGPATGGYTEALDVTATPSGTGYSASSPITDIVQGHQGTVNVSLTGGHAGVNSGSVALGLTSNGTEIGDGLGTTALDGQSVDVTATGYNYADPVWSKTGGKGTLTGGGTDYVLDLGVVHDGHAVLSDLVILSALTGGATAQFTDALDGSFTGLDGTFALNGFGPFFGIAGGASWAQTVSFDPTHAGFYQETIVFDPVSDNSGGLGDTALAPISLTIEAQAIPEPTTWAMTLAGFAGVGAATWRMKRKAARDVRSKPPAETASMVAKPAAGYLAQSTGDFREI